MRIFRFILLLFIIASPAWSVQFAPQVTPLIPPEPPANNNQILPYPTRPTAREFPIITDNPGVFGWRQKAESNSAYIFQNLLLGTFSFSTDIIIKDSNLLGEKLSLAEDALEYKLGLGVALGYDNANALIFSVPLRAGAALYFKERSFYGHDSFIGIGLNFNLIGTDFRIGGLGYQFYGGVLSDLGLPGGKTRLALGYGQIIVTGSRTTQGYYISASQPITL